MGASARGGGVGVEGAFEEGVWFCVCVIIGLTMRIDFRENGKEGGEGLYK